MLITPNIRKVVSQQLILQIDIKEYSKMLNPLNLIFYVLPRFLEHLQEKKIPWNQVILNSKAEPLKNTLNKLHL